RGVYTTIHCIAILFWNRYTSGYSSTMYGGDVDDVRPERPMRRFAANGTLNSVNLFAIIEDSAYAAPHEGRACR
ncbi:MAG: hypothetical protein AAB403_09730, partial [Planctomycetota bacterium]